MGKSESVFGARLRELRLAEQLTFKKLAELTGLSSSALSNYEYGFRQPDAKALATLESFFGVSGAYLLGETDIRDKIYKWDNDDFMDTVTVNFDVLFQNVLKAVRTCPSRDQKMVFDIMLELLHVIPESPSNDIPTFAVLSLLQETVGLSTQFFDTCYRASSKSVLEHERVENVRQSCISRYSEVLSALRDTFLAEADDVQMNSSMD